MLSPRGIEVDAAALGFHGWERSLMRTLLPDPEALRVGKDLGCHRGKVPTRCRDPFPTSLPTVLPTRFAHPLRWEAHSSWRRHCLSVDCLDCGKRLPDPKPCLLSFSLTDRSWGGFQGGVWQRRTPQTLSSLPCRWHPGPGAKSVRKCLP